MTVVDAHRTRGGGSGERLGTARTARVFLCEGEGIGWALDEDRRLTAEAMALLGGDERARRGGGARVEMVGDIRDADVVHTVWWEALARAPEGALGGKRVVCHLAGDVARCVSDPRFVRTMERVTDWVAPSRKAASEMRLCAERVHLVPYAVDWDAWRESGGGTGRLHATVARAEREIAALRARGAYIVGSIARDTEGWSLVGGGVSGRGPAPKLVKGPDVLVEIVGVARELGVDAVVLLAGPRRHWIRRALRERGVPVVFAGEETEGDTDDFGDPGVMLGAGDVAALYGLMDVHVCASRSEGGPRPVLEAAAAGCAQLSTRVGHAPDVLREECLFDDPIEAAAKIAADARDGSLRRFVGVHREAVRANHTVEAVARAWARVYADLSCGAPAGVSMPRAGARGSVGARRVAVWFRYQEGAWGGGNQFHKALRSELERRGVEVVVGGDDPDGAAACGAHLAESLQFDEAAFRSVVDRRRHRVVHRFDGPVSMLRRTAESWELDRRILAFNEEFAAWSVMQSMFSVRRWAALGLGRRRVVVAPNAPDPGLFLAAERDGPSAGARLRVVATSWAPNPGKGAPVYRWMGERLDPARFELTFIGRVESDLPGWTIRAPVGSRELGAELRRHDVYVTASREDPCSNSLCEALATALPSLYLRDGGHPELVGFGGIGFDVPEEIPAALERLRAHWGAYRRLIAAWGIGRVADVYEAVLFGED